ncbi:response regulator [Primorskyibacter sp. S187A]|uniref:response regulator n=1 Tax=Primorskyibacter sp. S187A TaxID=3415130 RepID=UPI003C7CEF5E
MSLDPTICPTRALIVDDHPLFCDALALTMRSVCPVIDVQTAASLDDALGIVAAKFAPEIVLLDLNLPDVNGLDGLMRMSQAVGQTPVVVVSSMADDRMIAQALRAGARGFVPKHSQRPVFETALNTIAQGGTYTPDDYVAPADDTAALSAPKRLASLTNQQGRILQLICEGKLNKQIAFDLSIAETTVKAHVTAIMRKLGVQSRTQAVLVAQEASFAAVLPELDDHG